MNTLRGRGSRAAGTLGRRDTRLSDAGLDGADGKPFRSYSRCCPTGLDFFPRNQGLWCYAQQRSRVSPMHSPGVPFREGEHCVSGEEAVTFAVNSLENRYFGSGWDPRSWHILPGSQHIGYCVQCGLVSLPISLLLRMKIWRVRPKKRLRSKFVGAVLWLRFIPVNAHVRGLR